MDVQTIQTLISGVGFPIVACIALFWSNHELSKTHREEIKSLTEVLEKNTEAIIELTNQIRK